MSPPPSIDVPTNTESQQTHRSPSLGVLGIVFLFLFVAGVAVNRILSNGAPYPTPFRPIAELQDYYLRFHAVILVNAWLLFGATMPFAIYCATAVSRLLFHRVNVAGVHIALVGGILATVFLGLSGLSLWVLSQPGVAEDVGAMRVAQSLAFASGGIGHTVPLGVMLAGLCVPSLAFGLLPRWLGWTGLAIAAICVLSVLAMVLPALYVLLPLGRFPAYLWLIVAGFKLPKRRTL